MSTSAHLQIFSFNFIYIYIMFLIPVLTEQNLEIHDSRSVLKLKSRDNRKK